MEPAVRGDWMYRWYGVTARSASGPSRYCKYVSRRWLPELVTRISGCERRERDDARDAAESRLRCDATVSRLRRALRAVDMRDAPPGGENGRDARAPCAQCGAAAATLAHGDLMLCGVACLKARRRSKP